MRILDWQSLDERERGAQRWRARSSPSTRRIDGRSAGASDHRAVRTSGDAALAHLHRARSTASRSARSRCRRRSSSRRARRSPRRSSRRSSARSATCAPSTRAQRPQRARGRDRARACAASAARARSRTVGLYVPAGTAPLPSTAIMLAVPARSPAARSACCARRRRATAARTPRCWSPRELCGIEPVFKVGGAQAIAALAYGTASIPKVDKIFGPGNAWVTAAKQLVAADPAGAALRPAGRTFRGAGDRGRQRATRSSSPPTCWRRPSTTRSRRRCWSRTAARSLPQVARAIEAAVRQARRAARSSRSPSRACRCLVVPDLATAHRGGERLRAGAPAPAGARAARAGSAQIRNAGSCSSGDWSPEPMGDYCSGTNHVLPTYGHTRAPTAACRYATSSSRITVQELTPAGLRALGPIAVTLARSKAWTRHARAVTCRLEALQRGAP